MSMINEELQKQQTADIGAAIKKVLGEDVPTIKASDVEAEERRALERATARLKAFEDAMK